jgi:hypothetical protein
VDDADASGDGADGLVVLAPGEDGGALVVDDGSAAEPFIIST